MYDVQMLNSFNDEHFLTHCIIQFLLLIKKKIQEKDWYLQMEIRAAKEEIFFLRKSEIKKQIFFFLEYHFKEYKSLKWLISKIVLENYV